MVLIRTKFGRVKVQGTTKVRLVKDNATQIWKIKVNLGIQQQR